MQFAVFTTSLPEWTPPQAVTELAQAGYDGIEWRITDQATPSDSKPTFWSGNRCTWPLSTLRHDVPAIQRCTASADLAMPALGTYVTCDEPEAVDTTMRAAKDLGVTQLRVRIPDYDPADSYSAIWRQRRAEYTDIAQLAAHHDVRALVEIHHGTPVQSPHAAAAFVADFDPIQVGVIHDVGNMIFEGWSQYRLGLEILGDHLAHIHLKNGQWAPNGTRADGSTAWTTMPAPLQHGIVNLTEFFHALRQVDYDGWVTLEDFSQQQPQRQRVHNNLALVRAAHATAHH